MSVEWVAVILAVEFGLIGWVLFFVALRRARAHPGQAKTAPSAPSRRELVEQLLAQVAKEHQKPLGRQGLTVETERFTTREKAFYTAMLSAHLSRDVALWSSLPPDLGKVIAPWGELTFSEMARPELATSPDRLDGELETERFSTATVLRELLSEYEQQVAAQRPASASRISGVEASAATAAGTLIGADALFSGETDDGNAGSTGWPEEPGTEDELADLFDVPKEQ